MTLRRLTPADTDLYAIARTWDRGWKSVGTYPDEPNQADIAVFDDSNTFIGMISFVPQGGHKYEAFLRAQRGASVNVLAEAAYQLKLSLRSIGMSQVFIWVMSRNRPVKTLCSQAGMCQDGLTRLEASKGRLWEMQRYVTS